VRFVTLRPTAGLHEGDQIGLAPLAGEIGLGDADALGRDLVVGRGLGVIDQRRVLARQQQAGVRLARHRHR
jgi:hypothetical protein